MAAAFAIYATSAVVAPAQAPLFDYIDSAYAPSHILVPAPIMGIRGEAKVLAAPVAG